MRGIGPARVGDGIGEVVRRISGGRRRPAVAWKDAEMDGERALGRGQAREPRQERAHRAGLGAGHRGLNRARRACRVSGESQYQRPGALGGAIADEELALEQPKRGLALAADRQRKGEPPGRLVVAAVLKRRSIIPLGFPRIAGDVLRKPAVARDLRRRDSEIRRVAEEFEGGVRLLQLDQGGADPHLDSTVARHLLLRPGEEGERRLRIAKLQRRLARAHQRRDALRVGGKASKIARQRRLRALRERARGRTCLRRSRRGREHCPRGQHGQAEPDALPQ